MYAATNGGLYYWNEARHRWEFEYGDENIQVNGMAEWNRRLVVATNRGAAMKSSNGSWSALPVRGSLHHISATDSLIFAMVYNELFLSSDGARSFRSAQAGMPAGKYTFQVRQHHKQIYAGQWDGVYILDKQKWHSSGIGLPSDFAATEMAVFGNTLVAASSGWIR